MKTTRHPIPKEQYIDIRNAVLKSDSSLDLSSLYSAVYLITPVLIAPLANVKIIAIKLLKAPIKATPAGPVNTAITLPATNPEEMRINVITPDEKIVLTNFKVPY